jgi:hypothetical protein
LEEEECKSAGFQEVFGGGVVANVAVSITWRFTKHGGLSGNRRGKDPSHDGVCTVSRTAAT